MNVEWMIAGAISLDLLIGDPKTFPHPVRWIGRMARKLENLCRVRFRSAFMAGLCTASCIYLVAYIVPFAALKIGRNIHPWVEAAFSIFIVYTTIAIRDLLNHSMAVYQALKSPDLKEARRRVGMIVGRDTENLSRPEIIRACVESVAESLVDGVTAPLFFAVFGGAPMAMLYRAVNTLDSLFGHKCERYRHFGTVAARVDDVANFIPARLTSPLIAAASALLKLHPVRSLRILLRDGRKHPSPNSGLAEAAVAGALGVRLGGVNYYNGVASCKPALGDPNEPLSDRHIVRVNILMVASSLLTAVFYVFLRYWLWEVR